MFKFLHYYHYLTYEAHRSTNTEYSVAISNVTTLNVQILKCFGTIEENMIPVKLAHARTYVNAESDFDF